MHLAKHSGVKHMECISLIYLILVINKIWWAVQTDWTCGCVTLY